MSKYKERFTRTLVRIEDYDEDDGVLQLVIPAWSPIVTIWWTTEDVPQALLTAVEDASTLPYRCHAEVTLEAEDVDDLFITAWEQT